MTDTLSLVPGILTSNAVSSSILPCLRETYSLSLPMTNFLFFPRVRQSLISSMSMSLNSSRFPRSIHDRMSLLCISALKLSSDDLFFFFLFILNISTSWSDCSDPVTSSSGRRYIRRVLQLASYIGSRVSQDRRDINTAWDMPADHHFGEENGGPPLMRTGPGSSLWNA